MPKTPLTLAALTLAVALPASVALATEARPVKPGVTPPGGCSPAQMAVIDEAFADAARRTAAAIAFLEAEPDHPHVLRWFGTARRKLVQVNLALTAAALQPETRPALRCDAEAQRCGRAFASANPYTRTVNFCPSFFQRGNDGHDSRFGVVVHEVSHIAAGTRDAAYQHAHAEALAKDEPVVAATNADNYEYFVETLPR